MSCSTDSSSPDLYMPLKQEVYSQTRTSTRAGSENVADIQLEKEEEDGRISGRASSDVDPTLVSAAPAAFYDKREQPLSFSPFTFEARADWSWSALTAEAAKSDRRTSAEILAARVEAAKWELAGKGEPPTDHANKDYRGWAEKGKALLFKRKK